MARAPASRAKSAKPTASRARKTAPAKTATNGLVTPETPLLEWISAAVGLVLFLATVGIVGWEVVAGDDTPPRFAVEAGEVAAVPGGYRLLVRVRNEGGAPAAGVVLDGALTPAGGARQSAQATFDLIADGSVREGALFFTADPRQARVDLHVSAYVDP